MHKVRTLCRQALTIALFAFTLPVRMMLLDLSGGHWSTLAELLKATQPTLIPGVVDEDVKRGNPVDILPFAQANHTGDYIQWLREDTTAEGDVADIGIGGATAFTEGVTYSAQQATLRICYLQRKLDKYIPAIHQTVNNYEQMLVEEMMRGITKKMGNKIIYDDYTYDATGLSMDGLHAWAAVNYGQTWDIDGGEAALALEDMRILGDEMKHGFDFWLMPFCLARQIDRVYREMGIVALAHATAGPLGLISYDVNSAGGRTTLFDGKPIIRSDFLVAEEGDTGRGTTSADARAVHTADAAQYSIFALKLGVGNLAQEDPGVKVAFGKTESDGEFYNLEYFEKLENYIGKAMRLAAYTELVVGSKYAIGRIFDVPNSLPVAST